MKQFYGKNPEVPMGLSMAMAKNLDAMEYFTGLSPTQQGEIIEQTHGIRSKNEMQQFVTSMTTEHSKF